MTVEELFEKVIADVKEDDVISDIDAIKHEFVSYCEDEFDDVHEAYEEQGRGQAEYHVVSEIVENYIPSTHVKVRIDLYNMLMNHWCL